MRRLALPLLGLFLLLVPSRAGAVTVDATVEPRTVRVGEQFLLRVTVEAGFGSVPAPRLPEFGDEFEVYSGNRTSRNVSIVNGKVSHAVTTEYVIVPRREGTFTIDPIVVETKDETVRTEPIQVTVTAAGTPPVPPSTTPEERGSVEGSEDLFVRATVDVGRPYVNQQVTYRVRLYSRVDFLQSPQFSPPTTQGFWREDLPPRQPYREVVNGREYTVLEAAFALFPTAPGPLTVGEASLDCTVRDTRRRRQDPFSFFGGSPFDGRRVLLRSEPVELDVRPLPAAAPPGFSGAVGDFRFRATVDKARVPQNETITLTLELTGEGNLRSLGELPTPSLPDFRTYPSGTERTPSSSRDRVGGTLREQVVLVPLAAGRKTIPSQELIVFSPTQGAYDTLRTSPIVLSVEAATGAPTGSAGRRGDIELVGRDIRFLELAVPEFRPVGTPFGRVRLWIALLPLPVMAYAALWLWERQRRRLGADVALRRRRGASRAARRVLKEAEPANPAARAAEGIRLYVAERFNLPRAGLTPDRIAAALQERGIEPEEALRLLEEGDAARFAPGAVSPGSRDPLDEADRMITRWEKQT